MRRQKSETLALRSLRWLSSAVGYLLGHLESRRVTPSVDITCVQMLHSDFRCEAELQRCMERVGMNLAH